MLISVRPPLDFKDNACTTEALGKLTLHRLYASKTNVQAINIGLFIDMSVLINKCNPRNDLLTVALYKTAILRGSGSLAVIVLVGPEWSNEYKFRWFVNWILFWLFDCIVKTKLLIDTVYKTRNSTFLACKYFVSLRCSRCRILFALKNSYFLTSNLHQIMSTVISLLSFFRYKCPQLIK